MVTRAVVLLIDDLDGGSAVQTVRFGLDGVDYEIDLSDHNARRLRAVLSPYGIAARRVWARTLPTRTSAAPAVVPRPPRPGPVTRADPGQPAAVRAWARANGRQVNDRGRTPQQALEDYHRHAGRP